jgi:hypothetical protein
MKICIVQNLIEWRARLLLSARVRKQKFISLPAKKASNVLSINDFKPRRKTTRPKNKGQTRDAVDKAFALP